jgi:hypothetical protein
MRETQHAEVVPVPAGRRSRWRLATLAAALIAFGVSWLLGDLDGPLWSRDGDVIDVFVVALLAVYVIAMALPFVPGIEIGMALMLLLGQGGILLVYLCTQLALALSFVFGRLVPRRSVCVLLRRLRMERASRMVEDLEDSSAIERLDELARRFPASCAAALLRHRHVALAVALNVPGNAIVGGAGGIGILAGMSRMFSFPHYALIVAAATTPVPVLLLLGCAG